MRWFITAFAWFLFSQCSSKESVPPGVLPANKMQVVLWDVLRADEMINFYKERDSSLNSLSKHIELYDTIFAMHKISKEDFKKSLQFYQARPDLLKIILDSLQKRAQPGTGSPTVQ